MYHPPTLPYSGLTITVDKLSRFDKYKLLSGFAGQAFENILHPISREACDIRCVGESSSRLGGTKVNLILGDETLAHFNRDGSLNELRGSPFYCGVGDNVINLATYHPQDTFDRKDYDSESDVADKDSLESESAVKGHGKTRRRNWRWWLNADVQKVKSYLKFGIVSSPTIPSSLYPNLDQVIFALSSATDDVLYFDIEVDKFKNITCLGLMLESQQGVYVIPWKRYDNQLAYSHLAFAKFLQALALAFSRNRIVVHNSCFDLFVMAWRYKIPFPRNVWDTMLAWHRCYPEIDKSLGHLISYYTNFPYHKSEGIFDPKSSAQEQQLWNYNAKDIYTMAAVYKAQIAEVAKLGGAVENSITNVNSYIRPYLTMSFKGAKIDKVALVKRYETLTLKRQQLERCLGIITRRNELNPRSSQQVKEYFYEQQMWECPNDKKPTDKKTLYKLYIKNPYPSVRLVSYIRAIGKLASSMKFRMWGNNNDRFTTGWRLAGTDTFRLASGALFRFGSKDKGFGSNFQNWDKKQRYLIIADENKILGQNDQSGAEALIVSYLCRSARFRSLFLNRIKPHSFVALHLFREQWKTRYSNPDAIDHLCSLEPVDINSHPAWEELKKLISESDNWEPKERYYFIAKMVCHAANYGMKWPTFQMHLLTKSEGAIAMESKACREFLGMYHNLFPEIQDWHQDIQGQLRDSRTLYNLFNEPRRFVEPYGDELWKQGYAFRPQSTVGEITNRAIVDLQRQIERKVIPTTWGFDILQNGHDSILWQAYPEFKNQVASKVRDAIEVWMINDSGEKFQMKSECSIGKNWGPYSQYNPDGLIEYKIS